MASLKEVIEGLGQGFAYRRILPGDGGEESLAPIGGDEVHHNVSGNADGGWGGTADLLIDTLNNGRFAENGWEAVS